MKPLTGCQAEVLALIRKGKSNKDIARELNISVRAVKERTHVIYRRMGITGEGRSRLALDQEDAIASLSQRLDRLER